MTIWPQANTSTDDLHDATMNAWPQAQCTVMMMHDDAHMPTSMRQIQGATLLLVMWQPNIKHQIIHCCLYYTKVSSPPFVPTTLLTVTMP
jgi:hypothetical protein